MPNSEKYWRLLEQAASASVDSDDLLVAFQKVRASEWASAICDKGRSFEDQESSQVADRRLEGD
jgi:hypothetical protein